MDNSDFEVYRVGSNTMYRTYDNKYYWCDYKYPTSGIFLYKNKCLSIPYTKFCGKTKASGIWIGLEDAGNKFVTRNGTVVTLLGETQLFPGCPTNLVFCAGTVGRIETDNLGRSFGVHDNGWDIIKEV